MKEGILTRLVAHLGGVFKDASFIVTRGDESLLKAAYNERRGQYDSRIILERLSKVSWPLADVGLYSAGLNFVFGQAQCLGRFAVVSTYRLRPEFYGAVDGAVFLSRVGKGAVHELGMSSVCSTVETLNV